MTYYKRGCWNAICDVCGFQFKSDQLRSRWDGLKVCQKDWETRHPQEFLKIPSEKTSPPWSRPDVDDTWGGCTFTNAVAIPNTAVAGCAVTARYLQTGEFV